MSDSEDRGDDFVPTGTDADPSSDPKTNPEAKPDPKELDPKDDKGDKEEKGDKADKGDKPEGAHKPDTRIPAARHKEILEKVREEARIEREGYVAELNRMRQGAQAQRSNEAIGEAETKLSALEEKLEKYRIDGETDKAVATSREIRQLERSINEQSMQLRIDAASAQAVETVRYGNSLERIEAAYPSLNEDNKDVYDKAKVAEIIDLQNGLERQGHPRSTALQRAVRYVMGPPSTRAESRAVESEARVDPAEVEAERKKAAVAKTANAVGSQPANLAAVGSDHDKAGGAAAHLTARDVMKMNQADFAKLDAATIARLRGDTVSAPG